MCCPTNKPVDASNPHFEVDHNRCILCTRCLRVCDEIEGAHTWDLSNRGIDTRVITDLSAPWGDSTTCTGCGKCQAARPHRESFHASRSSPEKPTRWVFRTTLRQILCRHFARLSMGARRKIGCTQLGQPALSWVKR